MAGIKDITRMAGERVRTVTLSDIEEIIRETFLAVQELCNDGKLVQIRGFGTFSNKLRRARNSRNPKTGKTFVTEDKVVLQFREMKQ